MVYLINDTPFFVESGDLNRKIQYKFGGFNRKNQLNSIQQAGLKPAPTDIALQDNSKK